jgi:hypothetical protein
VIWRKNANESGSEYHISLEADSNFGFLFLKNSAGTTIDTQPYNLGLDEWHHIEIYWHRQNSGLAQVRIDGVLYMSGTSDFKASTPDCHHTMLSGSSDGSADYDNLVIYDSITDRSQRLPIGANIGTYSYNEPGDNFGYGPDSLTTGEWADISGIPPTEASPVTLARLKTCVTDTGTGTTAGPGMIPNAVKSRWVKVGGRFEKLLNDEIGLNMCMKGDRNGDPTDITTAQKFGIKLSDIETPLDCWAMSYQEGVLRYAIYGLDNQGVSGQVLTCYGLYVNVIWWIDPSVSGTHQVT